MLTNNRMTAQEVLKRYAEGERDFRRLNLRGQSFKGKNLSGADFSEADIRGADFTNAILKSAKFKGVRAGLQRRWAVGLVLSAWLIAGVSGFFSAFVGYLTTLISNTSSLSNFFAGVTSLISVLVFLVLTIRNGMIAGFGAFAVAFAVTFAVAFVTAFTGAGSVVTITGAGTVSFTGAGTVAVAFAGAGTVSLFSVYIGWRALTGDKRDAWIRTIAVAFAATRGTSFYKANLTDVDFTKANLKNTNFRDAVLTRTCFKGTKKLDLARPGKSYLSIPKVQELVKTGQGQDKEFDRLDLRGINLQAANLADASFQGADLSQANLQDADLSRAKLVQTQLDKTDFRGATLTGAYIEDWGITRGTKFDSVRCEYVYMRLPTKSNPDPFRKPDNHKEVFADGEFEDFIKPIVDTLDLYHNQNVDPRAIAITFKQLAENHPEAGLEIVAIEKRGAGNVLLRAATSFTANRSELSSEYFAKYNQIKSLNQELKARLAEKDSRIISLENMLVTALQRPSFYAENYHNQGDTMSDNRGDIYDQSGNFGIGQMSGGTIEGGAKVAGVINEAEQRNLAETASEIQQLLEQLDKSYSTDTTASKMAIATEAMKQIESNPTLLARIMSALKAGGVAALDSALNHPAASFLIGALQDLQETGKDEH